MAREFFLFEGIIDQLLFGNSFENIFLLSKPKNIFFLKLIIKNSKYKKLLKYGSHKEKTCYLYITLKYFLKPLSKHALSEESVPKKDRELESMMREGLKNKDMVRNGTRYSMKSTKSKN